MYNNYVHNISKKEMLMSVYKTNMSNLRSNLADALDQVADGDIMLVKRRGKPDAALIDSDLLEDYLAATNPRIIKKTAKARAEKENIPYEEVFSDFL